MNTSMFYTIICFSNTAQNSSKLHFILRTPELSVKKLNKAFAIESKFLNRDWVYLPAATTINP